MANHKPLIMKGVFAPLAYDFLKYKRAQGYKYLGEEKVLRRFCEFTENYSLEEPILTHEIIQSWIAPRECEAAKSRLHRITCINQFGKYLKHIGYEVPETQPIKTWKTDSFTPYIFSHDEIKRLFNSSDTISPVTRASNMPQILPVLIRLLYSCGLRISEAVSLHCSDVDLNQGILTIRNAKFGKDRLIPISSSLLKYLTEYRESTIDSANDNDLFFMTLSRNMLNPENVYTWFRRILWESGISYKGKGNGPRLHDLRHTFAVHSLQKWIQSGEDLMAMLPLLSVFMGHKSFKATSRYLRLTAEVYPDIISQVEKNCAYTIPEVCDEDN